MSRLTRRAALACSLATLAGPRWARATDRGWQALVPPGRVAIMRHALAPGTGDPSNFRLGDCSTQRNLSDRGRRQAEGTGDAVRAAGVRIDRVLTSEWCRCLETADLLDLAEPEPFPALNSFFADRSTGDAQTAALQDFLAGLAPEDRVLMVTHQVNITALTGRWVDSGEVFILEIGSGGRAEVVASALAPA